MPRQIRLCAHPKLPRYQPLRGWRRLLPFLFQRAIHAMHDARFAIVWTHPANIAEVEQTLKAYGHEVTVVRYLERIK